MSEEGQNGQPPASQDPEGCVPSPAGKELCVGKGSHGGDGAIGQNTHQERVRQEIQKCLMVGQSDANYYWIHYVG